MKIQVSHRDCSYGYRLLQADTRYGLAEREKSVNPASGMNGLYPGTDARRYAIKMDNIANCYRY